MALITEKINVTKFTNKNIEYLHYEPVNICPMCKAKLSPTILHLLAYDEDSACYVTVLNYCTGCHAPFLSTYESSATPIRTGGSTYDAYRLVKSEPNYFSKQVFDDNILSLSPQFDKIYNQALAAESSQLDEIAGLGYRKALEFLIKDFAIHEAPTDEEKIKTTPLSQCIKNYITNDSIKTLSERSAWIGNDEAHYVRKQEDRDVSDMKSFIQACVYFIGMTLITEDAATIAPR